MEGNPLWGSWLLVGGPRVDSAGLRPASLTRGYRNAARFGAGSRQHRSEVKGQRAEVRVQRSEDRVQKSEVGSQRTEVNGQAASGLVGGVGGVIFLEMCGCFGKMHYLCWMDMDLVGFVRWIWIVSALSDGSLSYVLYQINLNHEKVSAFCRYGSRLHSRLFGC